MDVEHPAILIGELDRPSTSSPTWTPVLTSPPVVRIDQFVNIGAISRLGSVIDCTSRSRVVVRPMFVRSGPRLIAAALELVAAKAAADAEVIENPLAGLGIAFALGQLQPGGLILRLRLVLGRIARPGRARPALSAARPIWPPVP